MSSYFLHTTIGREIAFASSPRRNRKSELKAKDSIVRYLETSKRNLEYCYCRCARSVSAQIIRTSIWESSLEQHISSHRDTDTDPTEVDGAGPLRRVGAADGNERIGRVSAKDEGLADFEAIGELWICL